MSNHDAWTPKGSNILSPGSLAMICKVLETGPVIVEHWFYHGSRSPGRMVFDSSEALLEYLSSQGRPGDAFHVWDYTQLCRDDNALVNGKLPDDQGRVPLGGAY